jgi:hypothetical protein
MMKRSSIYPFAVLVVIAALFASGYWLMNRRTQAECGICHRHVHPQAGVVAEIGGKRRVVCCAHCARTEGQQENKPVRLIEVTDYVTRAKLKPEQAWYVDGSRVVACEHTVAMTDQTKHAEQAVFDRCSPGTFAFRERKAAEAFVEENGGVVLPLSEFLREGQSQ